LLRREDPAARDPNRVRRLRRRGRRARHAGLGRPAAAADRRAEGGAGALSRRAAAIRRRMMPSPGALDGMAAMEQTASRALLPAWSDCRASFIGWGAYMGVLVVYCVLYTAIVEAAPVDLADSAVWPVREWGIWLALTPLVCAGLRALHEAAAARRRVAWRYGALCAAALGA